MCYQNTQKLAKNSGSSLLRLVMGRGRPSLQGAVVLFVERSNGAIVSFITRSCGSGGGLVFFVARINGMVYFFHKEKKKKLTKEKKKGWRLILSGERS